MNGKFILGKDVFLWNRPGKALFYDCRTFNKFIVDHSSRPEVREFCARLTDTEHLCAVILEPYPEHGDVSELASSLVSRGMGKIVPTDEDVCTIPPEPHINKDLDKIAPEDVHKTVMSLRLGSYLRSISFFVGGESDESALHRQLLYPVKSSIKLDFRKIRRMILAANRTNPGAVFNIILSDGANEGLSEFRSEMKALSARIRFFMMSDEEKITLVKSLIKDGYTVTLILGCRAGTKRQSLIEGAEYRAIIRDNRDLTDYRTLSEGGLSLSPVIVADNNLLFLKEHWMLNSDDLDSIKCGKRQIYIHQKINVNYWGDLYVYPDGKVYPSSFDEPDEVLGTIDDNILLLIARELENNHAWRKVRDNKTCGGCIYQWLCPSPSPIERILNSDVICIRRDHIH